MNHPATQIAVAAWCLALGAALPGAIRAQAALPPTAPTAITPSQLPSANPPVPHGQASVHWDGHLLQITATGEGLETVLREVASRANIHVTGQLPDDRIYGTYGPAPLVEVLSDLVDGLPVNMLFVDCAGARPAELTFTARSGAASPPGAFNGAGPEQQFAQQAPTPPPQPPPTPPQPPSSANGAAPVPGGPAATTQPSDSSNPASPNGVKTPQEIFEQLQRLRANSGAQK